MIRVEIEETIHRPIEEVFARLVDIPAYPKWMSREGIFRSCTLDSEGPVGLGTRFTDYTSLGKAPGDVSAFEPPRKVVFHYTSRFLGRLMVEGWPGYVLEPIGEGATRVRHTGEAKLYGVFKVLRPYIQRVAEKERRVTVASLKRSLEETAASASISP